MSNSVFSGLAQQATAFDEATGLSFVPDKQLTNGRVLFQDNFDGDFCGWRNHYDGKTPQLPVGLANWPTRGGTHSLMLSTADLPYAQTPATYRKSGTYKNMGLDVRSGKVSIAIQLATMSMRGARAWGAVGLAFDFQDWDNSKRSFPQLLMLDRQTAENPAQAPAWSLRGTSGTVPIPGSATSTTGENENKANWEYVRLTIDLDKWAAGTGIYDSVQLGNRVFDVTTLAGLGTASHAPQMGDEATSTGRYDSFAGGFNAGIIMNPSIANQNFYPAHAFIGRVTAVHHPNGAL